MASSSDSGAFDRGDPRSHRDFERVFNDYLDVLNAEGFVDPEEVLAKHPELGPTILEDLETYLELSSEDAIETPLGTLGDYTLRRQIGRGGMGVVYDAWQNSVDRQVALKVLPAGVAVDAKSSTRFLREAQIAAKLSHPQIVGVYGSGVEAQTPYYAMEFVEGETLAGVLAKIKEVEPEAESVFGKKDHVGYFAKLAESFADVADGLQHAHSRGVIHRDIKPSNLILDERGNLRILDFGLARLEGQESLTMSGDVVGTPAYMSPEQVRRRRIAVDHRTDVYSLGATVYEALTGQPPFRGRDHAETLSQIIERDPRPPRQLNSRVPGDLETIVLKCLRKDADDRYGTAEALGQDLSRFVRGDPIEAQREQLWGKLARRLRRHKWTTAGVGAGLLLSLVGLVVGTTLIAGAKREAETERDAAKENLYVAHIGLALAALEQGNITQLEQLLDDHLPSSGEPDRRGWEWYFLDGQRDESLRTLQAHDGWTRALSWSPSGDRLASAGNDGFVRIWDVATQQEVYQIPASESAVGAIAWSPDGARLASGGPEGVVTVWDARKGTALKELPQAPARRPMGGGLRTMAWSADGARLACGGNRGVGLQIWDVDEGKVLHSLKSDSTFALAWSPNSMELAAVSWSDGIGVIDIWQTHTGRKVSTWGSRPSPMSVAWSPDGERLAFGTEDGTVVIRKRTSGDDVFTLTGLSGTVVAVAWEPDGMRLAAGASDGLLRVWNSHSGEEILTLHGHRSWVRDIAWNPTRQSVATAGNDGTVKLWSLDGDPSVLRVNGRFPVAWSPDERLLAMGGNNGNVSVLDAKTLEPITHLGEGDREVFSIAWSPDSGEMAVSRRGGEVRVWNLASGKNRLSIHPAEVLVRSVSWSPDGRFLATGGKEREPGPHARIWDAETGRGIRAFGEAWSVGSVAWSVDGTHLASATEETQEISVWEVLSGREVFHLQRHQQFAYGVSGQYSVAWNPNGDGLAAGSSEGSLILWDTKTGDEVTRTQAHTSQTRAVAWSPNGQRLASAGDDGAVKLWKVVRGEFKQLLCLREHQGAVFSIAWSSPSGRQLASASRRSVVVWNVPSYDVRE